MSQSWTVKRTRGTLASKVGGFQASALGPLVITKTQTDGRYPFEPPLCGTVCPATHVKWSESSSSKARKCIQMAPGRRDFVDHKSTTSKTTSSCVNPDQPCPKFGSQAGAMIGSATEPKKYSCNYDGDAIARSCADTSAYIEYYREAQKNPFAFDDRFMRAMCAQRAKPESCPDKESKYLDAEGKPICSNMVACPMCQEWAASSTSTAIGMGLADQAMKEWCNGHSIPSAAEDQTVSDPACLCINRDYTPIMQKMQTVKMVDPLCWYKPCVDRQLKRYLVPSDQRKPSCPDNVCTQIVDMAHNKGVSIDDMNQYMNCGTVKPKPEPEPGPNPNPDPEPKPEPEPGPNPNPEPEPGDKKTPSGLTDAQKMAIVGLSVTAVVLICGGVGVLLVKKSKK